MSVIALADFGSTFTKVTLVELPSGRSLGRGQAPTTVATDVMEGYRAALELALGMCGPDVHVDTRLAASSAGGGLRVVAVGLVEDLTAAAARQAALNAGARVQLVLAGTLGDTDVQALDEAAPEIILFSGGTDGGQEELVLANARVVARAAPSAYVIVACNRDVAVRAASVFEQAGHPTEVVDNVMPLISSLQIEPARTAISRAFITHVIKGKGLSSSPEFGQAVVMPTPEAVLLATRLLAHGTLETSPIGDVIVIDLGGATTDVHSAVVPPPADPGMLQPLLPVPSVLRTVEGDLGMRWSAPGVLDADEPWLGQASGYAGAALQGAVEARAAHPSELADGELEERVDRALAVSCVTHALRRHCGTRSLQLRRNLPPRFVRNGPDLRAVAMVVGTGGALVRRRDGASIVADALERGDPRSLAPRDPQIAIDRDYGLAAAGLLATLDPRAALRLAQTHLVELSHAA